MVGDGGDGGDDTDDDDGDKNEDKDGNGNYCNGWVPYYVGIFARPTSSWWLQMAWRQIGAMPSATTMLSLLQPQTMIIHITNITKHTYNLTAIKETILEGGEEVGN